MSYSFVFTEDIVVYSAYVIKSVLTRVFYIGLIMALGTLQMAKSYLVSDSMVKQVHVC